MHPPTDRDGQALHTASEPTLTRTLIPGSSRNRATMPESDATNPSE